MNDNLKRNMLKRDMPVLTADNYELGQTHALFHRQAEAEPALRLFATYLMVVNMTIGDDYYVPTNYIDENKGEGTAVHLTLTRDDIQEQQLTRLPQFSVANQYTEEKLSPAVNVPHQGKPMNDTVPMPANISANSTKTEAKQSE